MRHIKYKAELIKSNTRVSVVILEQSHIGKAFGDNGYVDRRINDSYFKYNKIILSSVAMPENQYPEFFLRGMAEEKDNIAIEMTLDEYREFKEAVNYYNDFYAFEEGD